MGTKEANNGFVVADKADIEIAKKPAGWEEFALGEDRKFALATLLRHLGPLPYMGILAVCSIAALASMARSAASLPSPQGLCALLAIALLTFISPVFYWRWHKIFFGGRLDGEGTHRAEGPPEP